jgi:hypothetical protein
MKKVFFIFSVLVSLKTFSQQSDKTSLDDYYIDFAAPDLSAFQLLGNSPNNVARPSSLKELTTGIMAFNNKGKIAPGVAMEWSPAYSLCGRQSSIADYRANYLLYAIQLTGATLMDSVNTACAWGFKWTPVNKADIILDSNFGTALVKFLENNMDAYTPLISQFDSDLRNYLKNDVKLHDDSLATACNVLGFPDKRATAKEKDKYDVKHLFDSLGVAIPDDRISYFVGRYNAIVASLQNNKSKLEEEIIKMKDVWLNGHWNSPVVTINVGIRSASPDGRWSKLQNQKFVGAINAAYPLGKVAQNIWQAKYNYYVAGDSVNLSESYLGTRLLIGNQSTRFSIEGLYTNYVGKTSHSSDEKLKVTVGLEFKLGDGLWFEVAGGLDQSIRTGSKPTSIASGNFKYALQKKRRF